MVGPPEGFWGPKKPSVVVVPLFEPPILRLSNFGEF